jgi:hypothetical protein
LQYHFLFQQQLVVRLHCMGTYLRQRFLVGSAGCATDSKRFYQRIRDVTAVDLFWFAAVWGSPELTKSLADMVLGKILIWVLRFGQEAVMWHKLDATTAHHLVGLLDTIQATLTQ